MVVVVAEEEEVVEEVEEVGVVDESLPRDNIDKQRSLEPPSSRAQPCTACRTGESQPNPFPSAAFISCHIFHSSF